MFILIQETGYRKITKEIEYQNWLRCHHCGVCRE